MRFLSSGQVADLLGVPAHRLEYFTRDQPGPAVQGATGAFLWSYSEVVQVARLIGVPGPNQADFEGTASPWPPPTRKGGMGLLQLRTENGESEIAERNAPGRPCRDATRGERNDMSIIARSPSQPQRAREASEDRSNPCWQRFIAPYRQPLNAIRRRVAEGGAAEEAVYQVVLGLLAAVYETCRDAGDSDGVE